MPIARRVRITRTAISPRLATSTVSNILRVIASHPEDAVGHRLERRVRGDRERKSHHGSGVRRVDDAVVPQPRGRVVGVALMFVLLADGRLERLLLVSR